nr:DUF4105 domain-containing protein [uncultured Bacteroides sp.]
MQQRIHTFIIYILLCCFICPCIQATEQQTPPEDDGIRFSLLTCGPGTDIYALFGHTALRYENRMRGIDAVFNYGLFSFDTPNFVLRFTLGETYYQLGATNYKHFLSEYQMTNRDVWQQTLNLSSEEKQRLIALLEENYRPENRVYLYNFFYDNCSTRPRDLVERVVEGRLHYANDMKTTDTDRSFRDIVHECCQGHPWSQLGIDLCLGSEADCSISRHQMMFAPLYLKDFFATATLADSTGTHTTPLVSDTEQVVSASDKNEEDSFPIPGPLTCALLLLAVISATTWYGLHKGKSLWGIDLTLFLMAGLGGCILAFLSFFSQHPAVGSNYMLFVLHPLHLFCLPCMLRKVIRKQKSYYMMVNLAVLTLFIVLWAIIPQKINLAVLPLALCLLVRSAGNLILSHKQATKQKK